MDNIIVWTTKRFKKIDFRAIQLDVCLIGSHENAERIRPMRMKRENFHIMRQSLTRRPAGGMVRLVCIRE